MVEPLPSVTGANGDVLALLPSSGVVRIAGQMQIVSLISLPGDHRLNEVVSACNCQLPGEAGSTFGSDPCLIWRQPGETLAVSATPRALDPLLSGLAAAPSPLASAVDVSHAVIVFELNHKALDAWLSRVIDSSAMPRLPGEAWRARLGDIAVLAVRRTPESAWLITDRAFAHYLAHWLAYSHEHLPEAIRARVDEPCLTY